MGRGQPGSWAGCLVLTAPGAAGKSSRPSHFHRGSPHGNSVTVMFMIASQRGGASGRSNLALACWCDLIAGNKGVPMAPAWHRCYLFLLLFFWQSEDKPGSATDTIRCFPHAEDGPLDTACDDERALAAEGVAFVFGPGPGPGPADRAGQQWIRAKAVIVVDILVRGHPASQRSAAAIWDPLAGRCIRM